jgi:hypothetical protein
MRLFCKKTFFIFLTHRHVLFKSYADFSTFNYHYYQVHLLKKKNGMSVGIPRNYSRGWQKLLDLQSLSPSKKWHKPKNRLPTK